MNFDEYVRDLKENSEATSLFEHNNIDGEKLKQIIENPVIQLPKYSDFYKKVKAWVSEYDQFPSESEYSEISSSIKLFIEQYDEKRFNNIEDTAKQYVEVRENNFDPILSNINYETTINEMSSILSLDAGSTSEIKRMVYMNSGIKIGVLPEINQTRLNDDQRMRLSADVLIGKYYLDNKMYGGLNSKINKLDSYRMNLEFISNIKREFDAFFSSNTSNRLIKGFISNKMGTQNTNLRRDKAQRLESTSVSLLFKILYGMLIYCKNKQLTYLQPHNNNQYKFTGQQYMLAVILDDIFETTPQIRNKLDKIVFFRLALQIIHSIGSDDKQNILIIPKYDKKVGSEYDKKCQSILRQVHRSQSKIDKNDTMYINTKDQFHKLIIDLGLITS